MGEGGAVLTNSQRLFSKVESLAHEGRKKGSWIQTEVGFNNNFTDIQVAIGVAQLRKLSRIINRKRNIYNKYYLLLSDIQKINFIPLDKKAFQIFWMTVIVVNDAKKLSKSFWREGLQTREIFYPLHMKLSYKGLNIKGKFF